MSELELALAAANCPWTPPDALTLLSTHQNTEVRRRVAAHLSTTPAALARLGSDVDFYVRREVACHPNTPQSTLMFLARDTRRGVSQEVPYHPNCPAIIKCWLQVWRKQMTLEEFLRAVDSKD